MKIVYTILAATVLTSQAAAQPMESLRFSSDAALRQALPQAVHPDLAQAQEPIFQEALNPRFPRYAEAFGAVIARVPLASILEKNRHILTRTFGVRSLDFGVASDTTFKQRFFTFTDPKTTTLAPVGDANRLRGPGVDARIDASTMYNFKIEVNIFSPARGSTLKMTPVQDTRGPKHEMKTGVLIDAIHARSFVFHSRGQELWLLYDADAKPDASGFEDTRSFLFIKEDGISSKAWPLAEAKLPLDSSATVDLGDITLNLTRTAAGELIIREAVSALPPAP